MLDQLRNLPQVGGGVERIHACYTGGQGDEINRPVEIAYKLLAPLAVCVDIDRVERVRLGNRIDFRLHGIISTDNGRMAASEGDYDKR